MGWTARRLEYGLSRIYFTKVSIMCIANKHHAISFFFDVHMNRRNVFLQLTC